MCALANPPLSHFIVFLLSVTVLSLPIAPAPNWKYFDSASNKNATISRGYLFHFHLFETGAHFSKVLVILGPEIKCSNQNLKNKRVGSAIFRGVANHFFLLGPSCRSPERLGVGEGGGGVKDIHSTKLSKHCLKQLVIARAIMT